MLNIIGGIKKKTKLDVPKNKVRPTSTAKRESIFSILNSIGLKRNINIYSNKHFIDLFAGTGSLGLEAISRGAKHCHFYEKDKDVVKILYKNCLKICEKKQFSITQKDITKLNFKKINNKISVIFIDPPYVFNNFKKILCNLIKNDLISKNTIIIIETDKNTKIDFPIKLKIIKKFFYGKTKITFFTLNSD